MALDLHFALAMRHGLALITSVGLLLGCGGSVTENEGSPGTGSMGGSGASAGAGGGGIGGSAGGTAGSGGGPPKMTGDALWSRRGDGLGAIHAVAAHVGGALAVAGVFRDTLDFGAGPMTSAGENDLFVARFDENGVCTWSRSFGGAGDDGANAVAIDPSGVVLVTGAFQGTIQVGTEVLGSAGSYDVPLIALDAQGTPIWARRFGSAGFDVAYGLAVATDGTIVFVGASDGPIDFGGGNHQGTEATFVAAIKADGTHVFSRMLDTTQGQSVAVDKSGHVAVGGSFSAVVDFGTGPLSSLASTDSFIVRLDPAGKTVFAKRVGDGSSMDGYAVAVSPTSDVVLGGMAQSQGVSQAFVALDRFSPEGGLVWSRKFGTAEGALGYAAANAIAIDALDHLVVAGFFRHGWLDLGCGSHESPTDQGNDYAGDMFVAKLDAAGTCVWSKVFGGLGNQGAFGVAADGSGHVVIGGKFQSAIDFGEGPLMATHNPEPCVARLAP